MQARCLLFEFQRRRDRAEAPAFGRNDFFNRLLAPPFSDFPCAHGSRRTEPIGVPNDNRRSAGPRRACPPEP